MYKVYIKNIFFSKIFWIAIIITLLTFIAGSYQSFIVKDDAMECYKCAVEYGPGQIVAMVMSSLPFLVIFSEGIKKRSAYYQIVRTSKRKYIFDQIMAAFTSVMGMGFIVLFVFFLICKAYHCDFSLNEYDAQKLQGLGIFENIVQDKTILYYLFGLPFLCVTDTSRCIFYDGHCLFCKEQIYCFCDALDRISCFSNVSTSFRIPVFGLGDCVIHWYYFVRKFGRNALLLFISGFSLFVRYYFLLHIF